MQPIFIAGVSLGLVLLAVAILDLLLLKRKISSSISMIFKGIPVLKVIAQPMIVLVAMFVFGVLLGGAGAIGGLFGTAAITGGVEAEGFQCSVASVEYYNITANAGFDSLNYTFTADSSDKSNYYIDSSNSSSVVNATKEISGAFTVWLDKAPATGEECGVYFYVVGPSFKDENSVGASASDIYDLLDTSRAVSDLQGNQYGNRVNSIQFEQDAWVGEDSAPDQERTVLTFTAGEASTKLAYILDLENTAYGHINKNSQFKIYFVEQVGDKASAGDPVHATLTLRKGAIT